MRRAALAALLALALLLCACASETVPAAATATPPLPEPPLPAAASPWEEVPVYVDGLLRGRAYREAGTVYLDPDFLCALYGLEMKLTLEDAGYCLELPGVTLRGELGRDYAFAGSRCLYTPGGYLSREGRLYLPWQAAALLFGVPARLEAERLELDGGVFSPMSESGADYYLLHHSVEDLYWLSHIIQAEADSEPLAGQIAVGNVVLNRVKSPDFPDSIREVIMERSGGRYQFEPMDRGSIHSPVDDPCMLAACLCLEGFNTAGESLFFVDPAQADSSWFASSRTFYGRIGVHDFYL